MQVSCSLDSWHLHCAWLRDKANGNGVQPDLNRCNALVRSKTMFFALHWINIAKGRSLI